MKELDFVKIWAEEFKKNPEKNRKILMKFVNSQIFMAQARLKRINPEKLIKIFNIKNEEIIKALYNKFNQN